MTTEDFHAYIVADELADPAAFDESRRAVYAGNPDERSTALESLLTTTQTVDGGPMIEAVLDQATSEAAAEEAQKHLSRAKELSKRVVDVVINPETSEIKAVLARTNLHEDVNATASQRAMADKIGWGHKQNGSSFRTSPGNTTPKH